MMKQSSNKFCHFPCLILVAGIILLNTCTSSYNLTHTESLPELKDLEINDLMVLVLYPDENVETRVALENSMVKEFRSKGIKAYPAYRSLTSYANLQDRTNELTQIMKDINAKNLLLIDPIRSLEHDESKYYNEVAVYRALGMESTEFWSTVTELAESADASHFIMGVLLWNLDLEDFVWQGTYDIKAPGGYELQNAKIYAREFANIILKSIADSQISL